MVKPVTQSPEETAHVSAMRLRVYLSAAQQKRSATWIWIAQRFRNEAVAWLKTRRRTRSQWLAQNKGQKVPPDLAERDCKVLSRWLTGQLEAARTFAEREFTLTGGKQQLGEAFTQAWNCLSRGEREEVRERCHDLGIHLDWMGVPRTILDQVVRDLDKTCQKAIKDRVERKKARAEGGPGKRRLAGFPVFKKAHFPGSIRLQVVAEKNEAFRVAWSSGEIVLPGLGRLRVRESGYAFPKTPPKLITLSRNAAHQWHVSFACVEGEGLGARKRAQAMTGKTWADLPKDAHGLPAIEGVDMSLVDLGVSNTHGKLGRVRHLKRYARKLRHANKAVSRKQKGSGRWKAACRRLGKVHTRVANVRAATLKQAATRIADRSAIVCVETLQLAFLAKNSRLAKSLYDLGWASFLRYLEDAITARGHLLLYAGQFTPTTQSCSTQGCDYINRTLKNNLKIRAWDCPKCGKHHDRDVNAANNIQEDAIRIFLESHGAESALSRPLHPELRAFLARGGMTAWGQPTSCQQCRVVTKTTAIKVPKKRELPPKPAQGCMEQPRAG